MTQQDLNDRLVAPSQATDVVELHLLLPSNQFSALEATAVRLELSVAALVRGAVRDFLRSPAAIGLVGEVAGRPVPPCRGDPMAQPAEAIGEEPQVSHLPTRPRGVLVVDDDASIRAVLGVGLGAAGFAVWLADCGREGVALYLAHRTAIDVVLLDVRMPGWDGPATLGALRALDPDVPCCFMSGDTGHYSEECLIGLGAADVFQKPFRLPELTDCLRRLTNCRL
jgi:two-component system, OmpR family, response regulator